MILLSGVSPWGGVEKRIRGLQVDQHIDSLWEQYGVYYQETASKHMDKKVTGNSLHGFTKGKTCLLT